MAILSSKLVMWKIIASLTYVEVSIFHLLLAVDSCAVRTFEDDETKGRCFIKLIWW